MLKLILFFWLVVGSMAGTLILPVFLEELPKDSLEYKNKHAVFVGIFVTLFPIVSTVVFVIRLLDLLLFTRFKNSNLYARIVAWLDKPYNG